MDGTARAADRIVPRMKGKSLALFLPSFHCTFFTLVLHESHLSACAGIGICPDRRLEKGHWHNVLNEHGGKDEG